MKGLEKLFSETIMTETAKPVKKRPIVAVIPFGDVPSIAAKVIAAHICGYLNLSAETLPPLAIPAHTLDKHRMQYDAAMFMETIEALPLGGYDKMIAILDVDLFIPLFTHVFGEARLNGRVGLVSLWRLGDEPCHPLSLTPVILERMAKIALHEMGHLLNVLHCDDARCLMNYSHDLETLDRIGFNFCRNCRTILKGSIG